MKKSKGFTLIELMIVVAIIGILAAIAIPKFADLIRKSNEGATKGNLGALRSAISLYYGELEGIYPTPTVDGLETTANTLGSILIMNGGKYIKTTPAAYEPPTHFKNANAYRLTAGDEGTGPGAWGYNATNSSPQWGDLFVNCTHTDTRGSVWSAY